MPTASFGGAQTFWREWGNGPRRAVMIHCSLAHSGAWSGVAERLADAFHLQAIDIPGHGRSGDWDASRDFMDQTIAMAEGVVGAGPVDLIGHSFGAVACLRLALERPDLVRSLVLYEPVLFVAAKAMGFDTDAGLEPFVTALKAGDKAAAARAFTAIWGRGDRWETIPQAERDALADRIHLIPAGVPALHDDHAGLLAPGRLEALITPALLLEGSAAPPVIPAINASLAKRLPKARRETIAGAGHMGPITHPGPVAQAIRRHLSL